MHLERDVDSTLNNDRVRGVVVELDRYIFNPDTRGPHLIRAKERLLKLIPEIQGFIENQEPRFPCPGVFPHGTNRSYGNILNGIIGVGERENIDPLLLKLKNSHVRASTTSIGMRVKRSTLSLGRGEGDALRLVDKMVVYPTYGS
jgi:hypothetical protein